MNRQYIGARYVPKFSDINGGVWDNTYSYEALEIVKHGNDFYTSKKPVPTGVSITNTDYWVKTGDYNGAINHLQEQIDTIDTTIGDHTSGIIKSVDDVQAEVDDINNNTIPGINTQMQNIIDDMVDVLLLPGISTGSTNVTDNDIHTVGSITLEAGKLYMLFSSCQFEIASNSNSGEHYIEQELSTIENPTSMGRGRSTWSGNIVNYTTNATRRYISTSNMVFIKPAIAVTFYMHICDTKSASATVTAYPSLQVINFD